LLPAIRLPFRALRAELGLRGRALQADAEHDQSEEDLKELHNHT
jgi:hypothetical protein